MQNVLDQLTPEEMAALRRKLGLDPLPMPGQVSPMTPMELPEPGGIGVSPQAFGGGFGAPPPAPPQELPPMVGGIPGSRIPDDIQIGQPPRVGPPAIEGLPRGDPGMFPKGAASLGPTLPPPSQRPALPPPPGPGNDPGMFRPGPGGQVPAAMQDFLRSKQPSIPGTTMPTAPAMPAAPAAPGPVPGAGKPAAPQPKEEPFDAAHQKAVAEQQAQRGAAKTPAEEQADRETGINRRQGFIDVAEGFGSIGRNVVTPGEIMWGMAGNKPPYRAEGARDDLARYEDRITPSERKALGDFLGMEIPETMPRSMVEKLIPGGIAGQRMDVADRKRLEQLFAGERGRALGSKTYNQVKTSLAAAKTIRSLLSLKNNPAAIRAAMVKVAKDLAGDTGVLTQQDIQAYEGKIGIPGFFKTAESTFTGNFTDKQIADLNELASTIIPEREAQMKHEGEVGNKSFYTANRDILERHGKTQKDVDEAFGELYGSSGGTGAPGVQGTAAPTTSGGTTRITIPGEGSYDVTPEQLRQLQADKVPYTIGG